MTDKIEELKTALRRELKKELSNETVKVTLTLNSCGFYTQIEERTAESLKTDTVSMRNLNGEWIKQYYFYLYTLLYTVKIMKK